MKFISIVSLALFAYTAVASPLGRRAASQAVQDANKADAQALNAKFATLNANSPCTNGESACVNKGFATCTNNKFAVTPCAAGEQCFALPLVNSRGTSITCDTQADAISRGGILAGNGGAGGAGGNTTSTGGNTNSTGQNGGQGGKKGKGKGKGKKNKKGKQNNNNTCNNNANTNSVNTTSSNGGANTNNVNTTSSNGGANTNNNTPPATNTTSSNNGGSLADIRKQNAIDAQALQDSFAKLNANSPCTGGQSACINGEFAQCSGNKFSTSPCAAGEQCFALPLVNKAGTSVTCDTQSDRDARFAAAKNGQ